MYDEYDDWLPYEHRCRAKPLHMRTISQWQQMPVVEPWQKFVIDWIGFAAEMTMICFWFAREMHEKWKQYGKRMTEAYIAMAKILSCHWFSSDSAAWRGQHHIFGDYRKRSFTFLYWRNSIVLCMVSVSSILLFNCSLFIAFVCHALGILAPTRAWIRRVSLSTGEGLFEFFM